MMALSPGIQLRGHRPGGIDTWWHCGTFPPACSANSALSEPPLPPSSPPPRTSPDAGIPARTQRASSVLRRPNPILIFSGTSMALLDLRKLPPTSFTSRTLHSRRLGKPVACRPTRIGVKPPSHHTKLRVPDHHVWLVGPFPIEFHRFSS